MSGPTCMQCGRPFLEDDGQVQPEMKIEMQRRLIDELRARLAERHSGERGPSGLDYDDPITAPNPRRTASGNPAEEERP